MKYLVICDFRENFCDYSKDFHEIYNDHPNKKNILEIISSIKNLGYKCEYFGGIPELVRAVDKKTKFENCMFLNFTDGMEQNYSRIQAPALLEILDVPYSGSEVFPSAIMNNKHFCKQVLKDSNIIMSKSCIVNNIIPLNLDELSNWEYPLFVKPNCEGSSLGISQKSVCHNIYEVKYKVKELLKTFSEILIEEYISGIDITNYLIGNKGNYFINDVITAELFDNSPYAVYDDIAKHNKLRTLFFNDEKLPLETVEYIRTQSIKIAQILGARDICRVDYRVDLYTQKVTFIEINSAPRFSSTSEIGFIASKRNLSFEDMVHYYLTTFNNRYL